MECTALSISDVLASVRTLGFATGVVLVLSVELILLLVCLWLRMRRRKARVLVPSEDESLGEFSVSFPAIRAHLLAVLAQSFPLLHVKRISLFKRGSKYGACIETIAEATVDMIELRDTVRQRLQSSLTNQLGLEGVFTKVDVKICGLSAPRPAAADESSSPLQPVQANEKERPAPLSLVKDLADNDPPAAPVQ